MFRNPKKVFLMLFLLAGISAIVDLPENYHLLLNIGPVKIDRVINPPTLSFSFLGMKVDKTFRTSLGLDLSGGSHIVLEADMSGVEQSRKLDAIESARQVIDRRVNFFGVSEPLVQTAVSGESYRVIVELPGITDVDQALATLGTTAKLEFREFTDETVSTESGFLFPTLDTTKSVGITGADLAKASLSFGQQAGEPEVALEFTSEGSRKFADVTKRLVGKNLAIFLDDLPLTWPRVNTEIIDGKAVITGGFAQQEAKTLALQLNAGALPVPVSVIEKSTVEATLGAESIQKSIKAGAIGLLLVAVYMVLQYGWLGVLANMALVLYGLLSFTVFRLFSITLTLPGIAGFILSIGMAVDSNILIFERYKEELRAGKPSGIAMELGFGKAWDSIRDANLTTILTALILYNPSNWSFLPSSGMVRGFAATLLVGVLMSLFTGIVASRTFIRVLYHPKKGTRTP